MTAWKIKYFVHLIFLFGICVNILAQRNTDEFLNAKPSTKLFSSKVPSRDSINDIQLPYCDHLYYPAKIPCDRYIFRPNGLVEYEDRCPGDYTLNGILGKYKYLTKNLVEITSDSIDIYRNFIDRIESTESKSGDLTFEILDYNQERIGKILTVYYTKRPTDFNNRKFLSLRNDDLNVLISKSILLQDITLEYFSNNERKLLYIPLKWFVKLEPKTYSIILRKNGYQIKKEKGKQLLYKWDYRSQEFRKFHKLVYKMD